MHRKSRSCRQIHRLKIDPGFHHVRDDANVSGEPVELGDHQDGFMEPAGCQGCGKLRAVATTPAFDLRKLGYGRSAVQVAGYGLLLSLDPEPAAALAGSADTVIGNIS